MKYGLPQTIAGILIVLIAVYLTGFMIHTVTTTFPTLDGDGTIIQVVPTNNNLFTIARYGSLALPFLGVGVIIAGVVRMFGVARLHRRSAIGLMMMGFMVAGLGAIIVMWGFPHQFHVLPPAGDSDISLKMIFGFPKVTLKDHTAFALVPLGLLSLGYGIVQYKKTKTSHT